MNIYLTFFEDDDWFVWEGDALVYFPTAYFPDSEPYSYIVLPQEER